MLARELTKLFETVLDDTLADLLARVAADPNQRKGEFVLLVQGAGEDADARIAEGRRLYAKLGEHLPPSTAASSRPRLSGAPRKALYGEVRADVQPQPSEGDHASSGCEQRGRCAARPGIVEARACRGQFQRRNFAGHRQGATARGYVP